MIRDHELPPGGFTELITKILLVEPKTPTNQLARELGCSNSTVAAVKKKLGITQEKHKPTWIGHIHLSPENRIFLLKECKKLKVTPSEYLNGLVTDVRLAEEGD